MKQLFILFYLLIFQLIPGQEEVEWTYNPPDKSIFDRGERITLYKSEVWIEPSGKLTVTETIDVVAMGQNINRGIFRTFPTKYTNKSGGKVNVSFNVLSVTKNNEPEKYHKKEIQNGITLYMGNKNVSLDNGAYSYHIKYKTNGQIGFFDDFDELYWNVNGNSWMFYIDSIVCRVHLPKGASIISHAGYSGYQGDKNKDFTTNIIDEQTIEFSSTKIYSPEEGLTIAVSWPKGFVDEPSFLEKLWRNYNVYIFIIFGLLSILSYYYFIWKKVGIDPPKGTSYPLFSPPNDLPPSLIGYSINYGYESHYLTCEIINLAAKGALTIKEITVKGVKGYILYKKDKKNLSTFEEELHDTLFMYQDEIRVSKLQYKRFQATESVILRKCKAHNRFNSLFNLNKPWMFLGIIITIFTYIIGWTICYQNFGFATVMFFCAFYFGIGYTIFSLILNFKDKAGDRRKSITFILFSIPFWFAPFILFKFIFNDPFLNAFTLFLILLMILNALFAYLLKAPTIKGQKLITQIEGFKMYLSIGEAERLRHLHPPEVTKEVFEKYLPYAMVLGVENQWAEKFDQYIKKANINIDSSTISWYTGTSFHHFNAGAFSSNIATSFSGATSASSTPPGTTSGSGGFSGGGGGSSGGGGGGGGGGGW